MIGERKHPTFLPQLQMFPGPIFLTRGQLVDRDVALRQLVLVMPASVGRPPWSMRRLNCRNAPVNRVPFATIMTDKLNAHCLPALV